MGADFVIDRNSAAALHTCSHLLAIRLLIKLWLLLLLIRLLLILRGRVLAVLRVCGWRNRLLFWSPLGRGRIRHRRLFRNLRFGGRFGPGRSFRGVRPFKRLIQWLLASFLLDRPGHSAVSAKGRTVILHNSIAIRAVLHFFTAPQKELMAY